MSKFKKPLIFLVLCTFPCILLPAEISVNPTVDETIKQIIKDASSRPGRTGNEIDYMFTDEELDVLVKDVHNFSNVLFRRWIELVAYEKILAVLMIKFMMHMSVLSREGA